MIMRRFVPLATGLLLTLAASASAADYPIKIQRPFKAAQAFAFSATDTYRASEKVQLPNSTSTQSSNFRRITLDADVRIDKVDAQGAVAVQSLTLQRLTLQTTNADPGGAPMVYSGQRSTTDTAPSAATAKNLLPAGTEVTITYTDSQPAFALKKGGLIADDALLALQQGTKRMSLSDTLYGTKERKNVGDSWAINKAALPSDRTSAGYIDPALITGTVTLKAIRAVAGIECLQIDSNLVTHGLPSSGGVPPREASTTVNFSCNLPTDETLPPVAWTMKSTTHVVTEEKSLAGNTITRTVDSEISHDAAWTPKR
jgi:hypothetical protein